MIRRLYVLLWLCLLPLLFLTASAAAQDSSMPALSDLEPGAWTPITPGGDTLCSNGTAYQFYVRPAATPSSKVMIHFQGGGACWTGSGCDLVGTPTYDPIVDLHDDPANYGGIFDYSTPENPFADYNAVMVSYCTGDVHIGNKITTYDVPATDKNPAKKLTIHHNGYNNAMAVLDWTFQNFQNPDTVFMTGCSAGAIAVPLYTQWVAEAYPNARIEELGDSAGGYRNPATVRDTFGNWGTMGILPPAEYGDFSLNEMTFEQFYMQTAAKFPAITLSEYNNAHDSTQTYFLTLTGMDNPVLPDLLLPNMEDISHAAPDNFRYAIGGGDSHCVTPTPDFYSFAINGVRLRDWVAALAAGEDVETVTCGECDKPEIVSK